MNLIQVIYLFVCFSIGAFASSVSYNIGGYWLGVPGFILGFLFIPFLALSYNKYRKWVYLGDTWMPDCSCGSDKFKYEKVGNEYHLLCQKCRTRYEKRRDKVWIYDNNEKQIYKQKVKFKGWV